MKKSNVVDQSLYFTLSTKDVKEPKGSGDVFNPYTSLNCPYKICWPRGYPLDLILPTSDNQTEWTQSKGSKLGVLQSLADVQPDVDGIFRLTKRTPFSFNRFRSDMSNIIEGGIDN